MLLDYGALMKGTQLAPDDEDDGADRKGLKFRASPETALKLKSLANVENAVKKLKSPKKPKVLSVNRMLTFIVERYFAVYEKENGPLPDSEDTPTIEAYAALVVKRRETEDRATKTTRR